MRGDDGRGQEIQNFPPFKAASALSFSEKQTRNNFFQTFRLNFPATRRPQLRTRGTFDRFGYLRLVVS